MSSNHRNESMANINITPLVDVMLVLLVVFMVTVPVIVKCKDTGKVDIDLPKTNSAAPLSDDIQTIIAVDAEGRVKLDRGGGEEGEDTATELCSCVGITENFATCLEPLQAKLEAIDYLRDGRKIYFLADRHLPYGLIVDVMARIKASGIVNLGMVTNPQEKP